MSVEPLFFICKIMNIEEINQITDIKERIKELKKYPAKRPKTEELLNDWDYNKHDVFSEEKRKKRKVLVKEAVLNADDTVREPAKFKWEEVNRIALPLEQDIVNIHTAFTVGEEPTLECETDDDTENTFFDILKRIYKQNKLKYANKRVVRTWMSECEVAEYWYTVESQSWWQRILSKITGTKPTRKLKSVIWSPFRGDKLFPYFNEYGDLIAFSREYKTKDENGKDIEKFMVIDSKEVATYSDNEEIDRFAHGFEKMPIIYMAREKPLCDKIRTIRNRLEVLISNFADCLDYNFYPKLVATGELQGIQDRGTTSEIINLSGDGASVSYLTWQQSPEMAKMEFENLTERAYSLTNTPRISFENLKGAGNALSGRAFKFMFMGTHLEVSNHAEVVEEFLQRRVNFITSAIGTLYPKMQKVSETIIIDTEIVPYMIDNLTERITDAVSAVQGGISSLETGIVLAGLTDRVKEEQELIEASKNQDVFEPTE